MDKTASSSLPSRPNLDHLRKQAKALLAALHAGEAEAATTLRAHLPAAARQSDAQIAGAGYRLADAQSAIARKTGFASWPALARHVEQLRALEGTWAVTRLEVDGATVPPAGKLLLDGDRFRFDSGPAGVYDGVFTIDVEATPHAIHIEFVEGPGAGVWNHGIFRLVDEATLELCLDVNGNPPPPDFRAPAGSGFACETLRRVERARPAAVTGGTRVTPAPEPPHEPVDETRFAYAPSAVLEQLAGEWTALELSNDGHALPAQFLTVARRTAVKNEVTVIVGGQKMLDALVRYEGDHVEYLHRSGPNAGKLSRGLYALDGDVVTFCLAPAGTERPSALAPGRGVTWSRWRRRATGAAG